MLDLLPIYMVHLLPLLSCFHHPALPNLSFTTTSPTPWGTIYPYTSHEPNHIVHIMPYYFLVSNFLCFHSYPFLSIPTLTPPPGAQFAPYIYHEPNHMVDLLPYSPCFQHPLVFPFPSFHTTRPTLAPPHPHPLGHNLNLMDI